MVETITPAGCGSRRRYRIALALFATGAVLASAALGALLGLAGSAFDRAVALGVVAVLALVAAAREMGLIPGPVPGARGQVPERWRREWPLPAWSLAYGAGLGVGLLTRLPVTTFLVACAGALALGDPLVAAACLAPFGLGRALMVVLPTIRSADPAAAVGRLAARSRLVRPVNAAALVAVAVLVGASPALSQAPPPAVRGGFDPAAWGDVVAEARIDPLAGPSVQVRPPGAPPIGFAGGRSPSLQGDLLAYADPAGIRVVRWTTGEQIARLDGPYDAPAIEWPLVAFRVQDPSGAEFLEVADLTTGERRGIAGARPNADLGRPALRGGLIAWHLSTGRRSQIRLRPLAAGLQRSKVIASSRSSLVVNPSLARGRILWVEQIGAISHLRLRRVSRGGVRTLATLRGPSEILWTTALGDTQAYATRWNPTSGRARVVRRSWRSPAAAP
jgi:hypothetical protein